MSFKRHESKFDIGSTKNLSLRVSVATLVRVLLEHPKDGELMLALERKATVLAAENGHAVEVLTQPFGGAIRIRDLKKLRNRIGDFHFDSEESRIEQDFRLFVPPSNWETIQRFCLQHLGVADNTVIETGPRRELTEEFADALKIRLRPDQYDLEPEGFIVEEDPAPTWNVNSRGSLTVRIYRIFEARILDNSLSHAMLTNSETCSNQLLQKLALENGQNGGKGRANAMLTVSLEHLREIYLAMPPDARNTRIWFGSHQLDETVAAVLEGVTVPKYQRL